MMNENKFVLPIISILLAFFLPASIYGVANHIIENRNKIYDHYTDGKIYYYDDSNNLLGIYTCQNKDCKDAESEIDDVNFNYGLGESDYLAVFCSEYVLVNDGGIINLYNLTTNKTITSFAKMKNYDSKIGDKYIIVQNSEGLYGLLNLNNVSMQISMKYNYLGVNKRYLNSEAEKLIFAARNEKGNYLIDIEDNKLTDYFSDTIYDYDNKYVYTYVSDNHYRVFDYQGQELLSDIFIRSIELIGDYKIITTSLGGIRIYKDSFDGLFSSFNPDFGSLSYEVKDNIVEIKNEAGEVVNTYTLDLGATHE